MIDINLIPQALRKDGKSADSIGINLSKDIIVGVGGGLVILMVLVHLILGVIWLFSLSRMAYFNSRWQEVSAYKIETDSINQQNGDLSNKIKRVSELTVKKTLLWAPKFNAISDALPKGVWIRKITLDKTGLTIEGSVVSRNQNEINNVGMFLTSLKQNDDFMNGFSSLEENSIQGGKNNTIEVTDFSVMAKLKT